MSDKKISALPASTNPLAGTEVLPIVQSGVTKKVSVADLTAGRAVSTAGLTATGAGGGNLYVDLSGSGNNFYSAGTHSFKSANNAFDIASIGPADVTLTIGNLVIGTAGKGIDFSIDPSPAGMTSELLDDYEEGTWTPTDASGAGLTLSITSATYTKIGNIVTLSAVISYPSTADISAAKIGGLPFNGLTNSPVLIAQYSNVAVVGYINTNAINIVRADNYTTAITNVSLSTNGVLISATYTV